MNMKIANKINLKILRTYAREILAILMLLLAAFFFRSERKELQSLAPHLHKADPIWLLAGALVTIVYIFSQGAMYVSAFRAQGIRYSIIHAMELFLKRNLLSVFLPAGAVSSLAYVPTHIRRQGIRQDQLHVASALYAVAGLASVIVVGLPILLLGLGKGNAMQNAWIGMIVLIVLTGLAYWCWLSFSRKKGIYPWLSKHYPHWTARAEEWCSTPLDRGHLFMVLFWSIIVEACGIFTIAIALRSLGEPFWLQASAMAYILSVLIMIISPFLRGLGAVELSIVVILGWYGINKGTALSATIIYRFLEFWAPLALGVFAFAWKGRRLFARIFPSLLIFTLGIINIISAVTPPIAERVQVLRNYIPFEGIHASNLMVFLTGLVLMATSAFLLQGLRSAWWMALILSVSSLLGHLTKALDWEEALFASFTILFLLAERKQYRVRNNRKLVRVGLLVATLVFASILVFGSVALYFNDVKNFGVDFSWQASVLHTARLLFLMDDEGLRPITRFAHEFMWLLRALAAMAWGFLFYCMIRPFIPKPQEHEGPEKARNILEEYGKSATDHFKIAPDKLLFFSRGADAFVAYRMANHYAVVLEEPVCSEEDKTEVLREFDQFCKTNGWIPIYYRVDEDSLGYFRELRKSKLFIGQEALIDVEKFSLQGTDKKSLRNGLNSLKKKGFTAELIDAPLSDALLDELEQVSNEWLQESERTEFVFSQGMFNRNELKAQQVIVVKDEDGRIKAFLNIIPDYAPGECTYDLIRKTADAPGGCMDLLIITLTEHARSKGFQFLNLGLAPMAGIANPENTAEQMMLYGYNNLKRFSQYKGLRIFKEKYADIWLNKYLVYENDFDLLRLPSVLNKVMQP